jgi:hypothetical protein
MSREEGILTLALLAGLALFWFSRNARAVGSALGSAAGNVAAGTVEGIGTVVGIPATDQTQCEKDLAAGNMWDASFSCPAGDFLSAVWGRSAN